MLSRMVPSSPPAMRTFHLLKTPDILCANDSRRSGNYYSVHSGRMKRCLTASTPRLVPINALAFTDFQRGTFHPDEKSAIGTRPYQMTENAFAFRIILSLVTRGTPRSNAVAPIILSIGSRG